MAVLRFVISELQKRVSKVKKVIPHPIKSWGLSTTCRLSILRTGEISPAADILALGISLIEVLSGKKFGRPKLKRAEHEAAVMKLLQVARFHHSYKTILKQCLEWNPNSRPTAARLEDELYNIAESLPGLSLRRWASQTLPHLEHQQDPSVTHYSYLDKRSLLSSQAFILDPNSTLDTPADESNTPKQTQSNHLLHQAGKSDTFEKICYFIGCRCRIGSVPTYTACVLHRINGNISPISISRL